MITLCYTGHISKDKGIETFLTPLLKYADNCRH